MSGQTRSKSVAKFNNRAGVKCGFRPPEGADKPRARLCVDGSACERRASYVVKVAKVSVTACGHHLDEAAEAAATIAGVELLDNREKYRQHTSDGRKDPMDRTPDDYDVSDHPAFEGDN